MKDLSSTSLYSIPYIVYILYIVYTLYSIENPLGVFLPYIVKGATLYMCSLLKCSFGGQTGHRTATNLKNPRNYD